MISIIIPTYNAERTIERCLLSLVVQDFNNYEVIIQDALSTDKTVYEVGKIKKKYLHADIKIFSEKDNGIYDAMNKGITKAKGEWLYFLGSDDYLLGVKVLSNFNDLANKYKGAYQILYGDVISPRLGNKYHGEFNKYRILENNICHQCIFYNKKVFEIVGFYSLKYKILADYEFNLRCFYKKEIKAKHIDLLIAYFEAGGLSNRIKDEQFYFDYPNKYSFVKKFAFKDLSFLQLRKYSSSNLDFLLLLIKKLSHVLLPI